MKMLIDNPVSVNLPMIELLYFRLFPSVMELEDGDLVTASSLTLLLTSKVPSLGLQVKLTPVSPLQFSTQLSQLTLSMTRISTYTKGIPLESWKLLETEPQRSYSNTVLKSIIHKVDFTFIQTSLISRGLLTVS